MTRREGSNRVPGFSPELWFSIKDKKIQTYICELYRDDLKSAELEYKEAVKKKTKAMPIRRYHSTRSIVEWCCSKDSKIGQTLNFADDHCRVFRITEELDASSKKGKKKALQKCTGHGPNLLWSSSPCVGGTTLNHINGKSPEGLFKILEHQSEHWAIWDNFVKVARHNRAQGGKVCIEWPLSCTYWEESKIKEFIKEFGLKFAEIHGCAVGLKDDKGTPINKPWAIASDDEHIIAELNKYRCKGCKSHTSCLGKLCKKSEEYTDQMVKVLHQAWKSSIGSTPVRPACAEGPEKDRRPNASTDATPAMPLRLRKYLHHPNIDNMALPKCAVAKTVIKKELERTPLAQQACSKEWDRLVEKEAWDMRRPRSKRDGINEARNNGSKAHFGQLFIRCVEKGSELSFGHPDRKFKGRLVFQGNSVLDEHKGWAIFNELGAKTAPVEGAKIIDLFGLQPGHIIQSA